MKTPATALIIVDVQRDFMTGGALAVPLPGQDLPAAETILPPINDLMANGGYARVVLTQDFHPEDHCSFAAVLGAPLFTMAKTKAGRDQVAWPIHCVQGTDGADFHPGLYTRFADLIIRKGVRAEFDSYSGFADDGGGLTGLAGYLKANGIEAVDVVGIATDYCVKATAVDAMKAGFRTRVLTRACAGVAKDTIAAALADMAKASVTIV
jgi:nicotinamidase/pyrazinamidase